MVTKLSNRNVVAHADVYPETDAEGYGAVSYTFRGYWTGHLPKRLVAIFNEVIRRQKFVPTIYSYGTPIAWKDGDVWIIPHVSYSITTSKHQSYLWQLRGAVRIPWDCGQEEYFAYRDGRSRFTPYIGRYGLVESTAA